MAMASREQLSFSCYFFPVSFFLFHVSRPTWEEPENGFFVTWAGSYIWERDKLDVWVVIAFLFESYPVFALGSGVAMREGTLLSVSIRLLQRRFI